MLRDVAKYRFPCRFHTDAAMFPYGHILWDAADGYRGSESDELVFRMGQGTVRPIIGAKAILWFS
jgi:hypothetical protein